VTGLRGLAEEEGVMKPSLLAATLLLAVAQQVHAAGAPVEADGLIIEHAEARAAGAMARTGAGYFTITNTGSDDRLIAAESPAAQRVELHTHVLEDGIARMVALEDGVEVPAGATVAFEPGGMHVMFMGLRDPWGVEGGVVVTLIFERVGEVPVTLAVDADGHDHHHPEHPRPDGGDHGH
jgi:periplasmic copper chaperone A